MNENHTILYFLLILYLATPIFSFFASRRKGRNYYLWTLLTILFNPLILILECLPNINFNQICIVPCRACKKEISYAASSCPQCGQPQKNNAYQLTSFDIFSIIGETVICVFQFSLVMLGLILCLSFYFFYSVFLFIKDIF